MGSVSQGCPRYQTVRHTLDGQCFREFSVGDCVVLSKRGDADDEPETALEPQNVYLAQIVDMFEDDSDASGDGGGEDSEDTPYDSLKILLRWFYYHDDEEANREAIAKREFGSRRGGVERRALAKDDFFFSDFVDEQEINNVTCIIGRAFLCASEAEARGTRKKLQDGKQKSRKIMCEYQRVGKDRRIPCGPLEATENDGVYLCRWFYKTDSEFNARSVRWLPDGVLEHLVSHPTRKRNTFDMAMNFVKKETAHSSSKRDASELQTAPVLPKQKQASAKGPRETDSEPPRISTIDKLLLKNPSNSTTQQNHPSSPSEQPARTSGKLQRKLTNDSPLSRRIRDDDSPLRRRTREADSPQFREIGNDDSPLLRKPRPSILPQSLLDEKKGIKKNRSLPSNARGTHVAKASSSNRTAEATNAEDKFVPHVSSNMELAIPTSPPNPRTSAGIRSFFSQRSRISPRPPTSLQTPTSPRAPTSPRLPTRSRPPSPSSSRGKAASSSAPQAIGKKRPRSTEGGVPKTAKKRHVSSGSSRAKEFSEVKGASCKNQKRKKDELSSEESSDSSNSSLVTPASAPENAKKSLFHGLAPLLAHLGGSNAAEQLQNTWSSIVSTLEEMAEEKGGLNALTADREALRADLLERVCVSQADDTAAAFSGTRKGN